MNSVILKCGNFDIFWLDKKMNDNYIVTKNMINVFNCYLKENFNTNSK